jgi:1,4-dihydroxy-2-naphthoate polyprenyltransferase
MKIKMWLKAMQVMPRLDRDEWDTLDLVSRWLIATRAAVFPMTMISALLGGFFAYRDQMFDGLVLFFVVLGLTLAHATNNLINDVTDHLKGVDQGNYFRNQYGPQTLESGFLTMRQMAGYIACTGGLALVVGAYLVYLKGGLVLHLFGLGVFFVLFYTFPLKFFGLGEVAVIIVWGPLMVGGTYYVITGLWDWSVVLAGLPHALGATAVIFGKHIDKLSADQAKRIRTLPVLLGERASRRAVIAMLISQYALVAYLVLTGYLHFATLIIFGALGTLSLAVKMYKAPRPEAPPAEYPPDVWPLWFVAVAFLHTRRFGGLYMLGLLVGLLLEGSRSFM